jgi:hypothetical protein
MLKKTITYQDFDGNSVTEDFYFHLTKAQIVEMEVSIDGGLSEHLKAIVKSGKGSTIIETFKSLIAAAYGVRSEDGKSFRKNKELTDDFLQSEAYSAFFMELVTSATAGAEFIRGIVPADMREKIDEAQVKISLPSLESQAPPREANGYTYDEMMAMHPDQFGMLIKSFADKDTVPAIIMQADFDRRRKNI